jgi:predicted RNA-binding Zn ribbon-like protein
VYIGQESVRQNENEHLTRPNWMGSFEQLVPSVGVPMSVGADSKPVKGNRLCLDFANLPFTSGDPSPHATSWLELVEFLTEMGIVSGTRGDELRNLPQSDPGSAGTLLGQAERLGHGMRSAFRAKVKGFRIQGEWLEPINAVLRVTEGHDELVWDGNGWKLGFVAKHEGLEWLLAAIARSGAELIAEGEKSGLEQCSNLNCQLLFYDESRTHRRRWCSMALCGNRSKVAAFARRHIGGKARAHHA